MKDRSLPIPSAKGAFPFRLGATSYILPDDLVPNVEFLSALINDVELLLFESEAVSNLPNADTIGKLQDLKRCGRISYSVHLPLDVQLGSPDEAVRKSSVEKCLQVIHLTGPIAPLAFIVHFDGEIRGARPAMDISRWRESLDRSVQDLLAAGVDREALSVETLHYPFHYVADLVSCHGLSICLDVGHLAFHGYPNEEYIDKYLDRTRVIHLHGNGGGKDHKHIGMISPEIIAMLISRLTRENSRERILTLEVFGLDDFRISMEIMKRWAV